MEWNHRQDKGAEWYFVAAPESEGFSGTLRFRSIGAVELWHPAMGRITLPTAARTCGETTAVSFDIAPSDSVFVVFQSHADTQPGRISRVERDGKSVTDALAPATGAPMPEVISASYGHPTDTHQPVDVARLVHEELAKGASRITGSNE